jgi:hypothetical protein
MGSRRLSTLDCRSEEGITVGLIDALISISRVLRPRLEEVRGTHVREALKDLAGDDDFQYIDWASQVTLAVKK